MTRGTVNAICDERDLYTFMHEFTPVHKKTYRYARRKSRRNARRKSRHKSRRKARRKSRRKARAKTRLEILRNLSSILGLVFV